MAQNVYSLNVVGYVNQTVTANAWYLWGNPLDVGPGNNTTATVLTNFTAQSGNPADWDGTEVYGFSLAAGYGNADTYYSEVPGGWIPGGSGTGPGGFISLTPGIGFFFFAPCNGTVTFVGQVDTNNVFNLPGNGSLSLIASAFPSTNSLTAMGLTSSQGSGSDLVYRFSQSLWGGYDQAAAYAAGYGWYDNYGSPPQGPTLNIGEGVFYQNNNVSNQWSQTFTIQ